MKTVGLRQIHLFCRSWLRWSSMRRILVGMSGSALALWAIWVFPGNCLASEPALALQRYGRTASSIRGGTMPHPGGDHRVDMVVVEAKGWERKGFRYRILLDSAARGAESSLDLIADEGGLLVIARDVDGVGGDLDL